MLQDGQSLGPVPAGGSPELGWTPQQRRRRQVLRAHPVGFHSLLGFHQGKKPILGEMAPVHMVF